MFLDVRRRIKRSDGRVVIDHFQNELLPDGCIRIIFNGSSLGEYNPNAKYRCENGKWVEDPPEPTLPSSSRR